MIGSSVMRPAHNGCVIDTTCLEEQAFPIRHHFSPPPNHLVQSSFSNVCLWSSKFVSPTVDRQTGEWVLVLHGEVTVDAERESRRYSHRGHLKMWLFVYKHTVLECDAIFKESCLTQRLQLTKIIFSVEKSHCKENIQFFNMFNM